MKETAEQKRTRLKEERDAREAAENVALEKRRIAMRATLFDLQVKVLDLRKEGVYITTEVKMLEKDYYTNNTNEFEPGVVFTFNDKEMTLTLGSEEWRVEEVLNKFEELVQVEKEKARLRELAKTAKAKLTSEEFKAIKENLYIL